MADVELLRAENKRLANALQSLLRYVERCREAGVLVCDDIGPEEFARYELEQALSLPPEQPAAVDEAWRQKAAAWLEAKAVEQEANNQRWPDHAAAYKEWRDRPGVLRYLAAQVLAAQQQGGAA